jgi:hypothetical protein
MVRIAISREAYDAIYATLLLGSVAVELEANERGERLIWLALPLTPLPPPLGTSVFAFAEIGRLPEPPLNLRSDPMHRADSDRAGLAAGLELSSDSLQELRPPTLVDRLGQREQQVLFLVGKMQRRHGRGLRTGARHDGAATAATSRGRQQSCLDPRVLDSGQPGAGRCLVPEADANVTRAGTAAAGRGSPCLHKGKCRRRSTTQRVPGRPPMPTDEAPLPARQANAPYAADYERRLAAEIVAMLPEDREEAKRVLKLVGAILALPVGEPEGESRNRPAV